MIGKKINSLALAFALAGFSVGAQPTKQPYPKSVSTLEMIAEINKPNFSWDNFRHSEPYYYEPEPSINSIFEVSGSKGKSEVIYVNAYNSLKENIRSVEGSYMLLTPDRQIVTIDFKDIFKPADFQVLIDAHKAYGQIQAIELPNGVRKPIILHPGYSAMDSILEEKLGMIRSNDPDPTLRPYSWKTASKLYEVDMLTGFKGRYLGNLIDIYSGKTINNGLEVGLKVKRFFPAKAVNNHGIPESISVAGYFSPTGQRAIEIMEGEAQKREHPMSIHAIPVPLDKPIVYVEFVVDENLKRTKSGIFSRFDQPIYIENYNKPCNEMIKNLIIYEKHGAERYIEELKKSRKQSELEEAKRK